ncbi:patatin-family protein [Pelomyxa schiedti]|nr:patatin-family protein [Pelomyxa schiedti]
MDGDDNDNKVAVNNVAPVADPSSSTGEASTDTPRERHRHRHRSRAKEGEPAAEQRDQSESAAPTEEKEKATGGSSQIDGAGAPTTTAAATTASTTADASPQPEETQGTGRERSRGHSHKRSKDRKEKHRDKSAPPESDQALETKEKEPGDNAGEGTEKIPAEQRSSQDDSTLQPTPEEPTKHKTPHSHLSKQRDKRSASSPNLGREKKAGSPEMKPSGLSTTESSLPPSDSPLSLLEAELLAACASSSMTASATATAVEALTNKRRRDHLKASKFDTMAAFVASAAIASTDAVTAVASVAAAVTHITPEPVLLPPTPRKPCLFTLTIVEASDLVPMDTTGTSDPYTEVLIPSFQKSRSDRGLMTHVIPKTLEPVWNTEFQLFCHPAKTMDLRFKVWDRDTVSADDFEGECEFTAEPGVDVDEWLLLKHKRKGLLHIRITWDPLPTLGSCPWERRNTVRILSIDGGGIRGIIPGIILALIEYYTGKRISDLFDIIAGTSTGGLLACMLTHPDPHLSAADALSLYTDCGPLVFTPRGSVLLGPQFKHQPLETKMLELMGPNHHKFGNVTTNVLITSFDMTMNQMKFWKSWEEEDAEMEKLVLCRMTSSAPTYFKPQQDPITGHTHIDGGIGCNNPVLAAYSSAKVKYPKATHYVVLSLGTGTAPPDTLESTKVNKWGVVQWIQPLINALLLASSHASSLVMSEVASHPRIKYLRVDTELKYASAEMSCVTPSNLVDLVREGAHMAALFHNDLINILSYLLIDD